MHSYRAALAGAVFLAFLGAGCRGCAERAETAAAAPDGGVAAPIFPPGTHVLPIATPLGVKMVYLPAVLVVTMIFDGEDVDTKGCSGALIDSRVAVVAGHCVCRFREATTSDKRGHALKGTNVTSILDSRSPCGTHSVVFAFPFGKPGEKPVPREYSGTVVVHPDIELIARVPQGESQVAWNHADVAVIRLREPVLGVQPLSLPNSEVKLGDALVVAGYSPTGSESLVTKISRHKTGNVIFEAATPPDVDGGVRAHARPGNDGRAYVSKDDPNVLIGIVTMAERPDAGDETSYFTSVYPHAGWLSGFIRQADLAADGGVNAVPKENP